MTNKDENELLPCPFCGVQTDDGFLPHKSSCYIIQKAVGASPEILKSAWNTRAEARKVGRKIRYKDIAGTYLA